jgi:predicted phosphodiesterase
MNKDMKRKGSLIHRKVGIVADSHGRPDTIIASLDFLSKRNCQAIYHLGDICDSFHPETSEACLRPLQECMVKAIKGNNDHAILANQIGLEQESVSKKTLNFLRDLPLVTQYENATFTHSLPFVSDLGLACMIGAMGQMEARKFFQSSPKGLLFRGHSHTPEIIWSEGQSIRFQTISAGQKVGLEDRLPSVVTCGALTRGLCMVWRPEENLVECHSFL